MKLFIIRHGQSQDNASSLQTGDRGLTSIGRQQALATGRFLHETPIDVLFTSPARRTIETACIIAAELDRSLVVRADIFERGFLFDEPGMTGNELRALCPRVEPGDQISPNRGWAVDRSDESTAELFTRSQATLASLRNTYPDDRSSVALISHAYFSGYLLAVAMGFTFEQVQKHWLRMNNCGVSCVEFRDHATMLWYLNNHSHLDELITR